MRFVVLETLTVGRKMTTERDRCRSEALHSQCELLIFLSSFHSSVIIRSIVLASRECVCPIAEITY